MFQRNKYLFGLAAALILFLLIGFGLTNKSKTTYPAFVSFSSEANGTKAIRTLIEQKGMKARDWKQPWAKLQTLEKNQTLVVIAPNSVMANELKELLQWVDEGNQLLLFQAEPKDMPDLVNEASVEEKETVGAELKAFLEGEKKQPDIPLSRIKEPNSEVFSGKMATGSRIKANAMLTVLLQDEQGILAAQAKHGKGSITLFLTPEWLKNDTVLLDDNFEMVWGSFQQLQGTVWFDEYHHGYQVEPSLSSVYPGWLLIIYVQLLLALLLWLWWKGKRFGSVVTPREWVVRRGDETLLAIASWYQRSGNHQAALAHQERYLYQLFYERWGVRTHTQMEEVIAIAQRKWEPKRVLLLQELLYRLELNRSRSAYSAKQFVEDSHAVAGIIEAVEKE